MLTATSVRYIFGVLFVTILAVFSATVNWKYFVSIFIPYVFVGALATGVVKFVHAPIDKEQGGDPIHSPWMAKNFFMFILIAGMIHTCIIDSLNDIKLKFLFKLFSDLFIYGNLAVFVEFISLAYPGDRSNVYRMFISWISCAHFGACALSILFMTPLTLLTSYYNYGFFPYVTTLVYTVLFWLNCFGVYEAINIPRSLVYIRIPKSTSRINSNEEEQKNLTKELTSSFVLHRSNDYESYVLPKSEFIKHTSLSIPHSSKNTYDATRTLRIIQIADPHLGPLLDVRKMKELCEEIKTLQPDLVLITGDFYTGESNADGLLEEAFSPLKSLADDKKVYACLGNHDIETFYFFKRTVKELSNLNIKLLRNESTVITTRIGDIQLIGFDFYESKSKRSAELLNVINNNPCPSTCNNRRIVLLHDPDGFNDFKGDENLLVFSGHTHGGHIGIVFKSFSFTFSQLFDVKTDYGLWNKGNNYLYVHKGQGTRSLYANFVGRIGISPEHSLVHVSWQ